MLNFIKENPAVSAAIIAATVAFLAAIVSYIVSKRSSYILAVTAERTKWIDKLRENIASLSGICSSIHLMSINNVMPPLADIERADRLIALIQMQLNPHGTIDKNIISLLPDLIASSQKTNSGYRNFEKKFIQHAQFLLKEEWETVKREAMGPVRWYLGCHACKACQRKSDYEAFLKKL